MLNLLYCILHTKNQPDRYNNIINTWAKNTKYLFYADYSNGMDVIEASKRSDYSSAEEKQVNIINILAENKLYNHYEWYFFCDNDTFVNVDNLNILSQSCDKNSVHGLVATSWPIDPSLHYCGGGAGILISHNVLQKLHNNVFIHNTGYSDVTLGICLRNLNIPLQHQPTFHSFPPTHYNYDITNIAKQTTFHYIKDFFTMQGLYENTKSNT